jgi:hypothetical protein
MPQSPLLHQKGKRGYKAPESALWIITRTAVITGGLFRIVR